MRNRTGPGYFDIGRIEDCCENEEFKTGYGRGKAEEN
jgi:hypothetical protein